MTILILHGIGGKAGDHWEQWLHDKLTEKGHTVIMPNLPQSAHPDRGLWLQTVKKNLKDVNVNRLVIFGHSLGVATALDFTEQTTGKIRALVSLAGFPYDYGSDLNNYFMKQKQIDFIKVKEHLSQSFIIYGDNDPYVPQKALHDLAVELGVSPIVIPNGGHINTEAGYTSFPLLIEIVENLK